MVSFTLQRSDFLPKIWTYILVSEFDSQLTMKIEEIIYGGTYWYEWGL